MARDDEIRDELQALFAFAHIHKWCTQLDERIAAFLALHDGRDRARVRAIVEEEYADPSGPKEHLVLALLLTAKLGESNFVTTERLFARLRGRLDLADENVLRAHLFRSRHPLPSDVTYDIGSRAYLSFRRAISHGMKIRTVQSTFTPAEVALYLTMIMCRVDLHEQNRAMLSFLMYRIDARLPDNVVAGTLAYLRSLKAIIAELERKGDAALSGEFNYAEEPTIGDTVSPDGAERSIERSIRSPDTADDEQTPDTERAPSSGTPEGAPHRRGPAALYPESGAEADRPRRFAVDGTSDRDRRGDGAPIDSSSRAPQPAHPFPVTEADIVAGTRLSDPVGAREGDADRLRSEASADESRSDLGERLGTVAGNIEASAESGRGAAGYKARGASGEEATSDYTIHFNRNLSELLRIIEGIDGADVDGEETATHTDAPADETIGPPAAGRAGESDAAAPSPASAGRTSKAGRTERKDRAVSPDMRTPAPEASGEGRPGREERRESTPASPKEHGRAADDTGGTAVGPTDAEPAQPSSSVGDASPVELVVEGVESGESHEVENGPSRTGVSEPETASALDAADASRANATTSKTDVKPRDAVEQTPLAPASDAATGPRDREAGGGRRPSRGRRVPFRAIVAVGVALLSVLVLIVRGNRRDHGEVITRRSGDGDTLIETGEPSAASRSDTEPRRNAQSPSASDRREGRRGEEGAVAIYRIEGGQDGFVWTVAAGQTAWDLFRRASDASIATADGTPYSVSPDVTWLQYILDVFEANPQLEQFAIIVPGQRIALPDYR